METSLTTVEKITLLPSKDPDRINAQKLANAAPELLKALQHIAERIETVRSGDAFCQALKDISIEAIKKATP